MSTVHKEFPLVTSELLQSPEYRTRINTADISGWEQRIKLRGKAKRRYNGVFSVKDKADADLLLKFFHTCEGKYIPFVLKDYQEFQYDWTDTGVLGDGGISDFQMSLVYEDTFGTVIRRNITKPMPMSVGVRVAGTEKVEDTHFTVDYDSGVISFTGGNIPTAGQLVETKCDDYRVPVRFLNDTLDRNMIMYWVDALLNERVLVAIPDIPLIEIFDYSGTPSKTFVAPPVQTAATGIGPSVATLNYTPGTGGATPTGYEYRLNEADAGYGGWVDAGAGTSEDLTGLTQGVNFKAQIRAYDGAGNKSEPSNEISFTTGTLFVAIPVQANITNVGNTTATLNYTPGVGGEPVTGYEYSLKIGAGSYGSWIDAGAGVSEDLTGLTSSSTYTARIRAYEAGGSRSDPSNEKTFNTGTPFVATPTQQAASGVGETIATLNYTEGTTPAGGETVTGFDYRLKIGAGSYGSWIDAGAGLSEALTGLTTDSQYTAEVRAYDATALKSASSNEIQFTPTAAATIPVASLQALYEAQRETGYSNGADVTTLTDFEGSEDGTPAATEEAKFISSDSEVNNKAVFDFTHADDSHYDFSIPLAAGGYSIVVVLKFNGVETVRNGLFEVSGGGGVRATVTGAWTPNYQTVWFGGGGGNADIQYVAVELWSDGLDTQIYEDNATMGALAVGKTWAGETIDLFGRMLTGGGYPLDSRVAMLAVFNEELVGQDRTDVYDYINTEFGI